MHDPSLSPTPLPAWFPQPAPSLYSKPCSAEQPEGHSSPHHPHPLRQSRFGSPPFPHLPPEWEIWDLCVLWALYLTRVCPAAPAPHGAGGCRQQGSVREPSVGAGRWTAAMLGALPPRRQPGKAGQGGRRAGFPPSRPAGSGSSAAVPHLDGAHAAVRGLPGQRQARDPVQSTPG